MKCRIFMTAVLCILVSSCTHKELCYDHPHIVHVDVEFDWSLAPEADPKTMSLYLFPQKKNSKVQRYELVGSDGGRIRLSPGLYHAVCINSDTENIVYRGTGDFHTFGVTTKDAVSAGALSLHGIRAQDLPRSKASGQERMARQPDIIYSTHMSDIEIVEEDVSTHRICLAPRSTVCRFNVEISNAKNLKWVRAVSGSLSCLAEGMTVKGHALSESCVTIPFDAAMDKENDLITGKLTALGHCPAGDNRHMLIIYAILADESKWYYTYDVTDQIHNSPDPYNINIRLNEIPIPKPVANGGGFKPTIDEWNSVEINIKL